MTTVSETWSSSSLIKIQPSCNDSILVTNEVTFKNVFQLFVPPFPKKLSLLHFSRECVQYLSSNLRMFHSPLGIDSGRSQVQVPLWK